MKTILKFFTAKHLPDKLQRVSEPICKFAREIDDYLPDCDEKAAGMRKLLEAKDCFVRSALNTEVTDNE